MIKGLFSDTSNKNLHDDICFEKLKQQNNYFEVITDGVELKPFIDLDGSFSNNISKEQFENIDNQILEKLKTLENTSILSSSHYEALKIQKIKGKSDKKEIVVKLSYKIVWINEKTTDIKTMKDVIKEQKTPLIQKLLHGLIDVTTKAQDNCLNIDFSVYRAGFGKMRCVNAYKYPEQQDRYNKLIKGNIEDTIININKDESDKLILLIPNKIERKQIEEQQKQQQKKIEQEQKQEQKQIKKDKKQEEKEEQKQEQIQEKIKQKQEKDIDKKISKRDFTEEQIVELLNIIGNKADWEQWNTIGLVLHDNWYTFKTFDDWSKMNKKYDKDSTKNQWDKKYPKPTGVWVIYTLLKYAKEENSIEYNLWCKKNKAPHILSIFAQGSNIFDEEYKKEIFVNLKYSKGEWYSCDKITKLWRIDERAEKSVLDFIETKMKECDCSYQMKTFETGSFLTLLINCLKKSLCDDEFYSKIETPQDCIAFKNGLYNIQTKVFQKGFKAENYVSKTLDYDYQINYKSNKKIKDEIISNLIKLLNNSENLLDFVMRLFGYTITGRASEKQEFYSFVGQKGGNGKTTLLAIAEKIFKIYYKKVTPKCFEADYSKAHKDLAGIQGTRFLVSEEFRQGAKLNEQLVKVFRDGLTTENEVMFGTSKTLKITCKTFFTSNATLTFSADGGMSRGYRQVNFNSRFVPDKETSEYKHEPLCFQADPTFLSNFDKPEYRDELLYIILEYGNKYYSDGLITPQYIIKQSSDTCNLQGEQFKTFFEDNYILDHEGIVFREDFESIYNASNKKSMDIKQIKDELARISDNIIYDRNKKGSNENKDKRGCFIGFTQIKNED